jgi:PAS domain S-box-containing protein
MEGENPQRESAPDSHEFAGILIESANVVVIAADREGRVRFINPKGEEVLGYRSKDLVGSPWMSLFSERIRPVVRRRIEGVLRGEAAAEEIYPAVTRSGEERIIRWNCASIRDASGNPVGVCGIGVDVTEKHQIETEIRAHQREREILFSISQKVRELLDLDSLVQEVMDQIGCVIGTEILGLFLFEQGLLHLLSFRGISPSFARQIEWQDPAELPSLSRVLDSGQTMVIEDISKDPDLPQPLRDSLMKESIRWAVILPLKVGGKVMGTWHIGYTSPFEARSVEISFLEAVASEIAVAVYNASLYKKMERGYEELKEAQSRLIQAEKLSVVEEVLSGVAHEINNPLTSIIGFSEILLGLPIPENVRLYAERIFNQGRRSAEIVRSLLAFSRRSPPVYEKVDLNYLLRMILDLKQYQLKMDGVDVTLELDPDLPKTLADANQIQQIIFNILNNAHQALLAAEGDRRILIRSERLKKAIRVTVRDNGPGIPKEIQSRIFEPFFTTKPLGKGTGLGLSVSYGILQQHGGSIGFESEAGSGASFWFEIPVRSTFEGEASSRREGSSKRYDGKRALVVEDEEAVMEVCKIALEQIGIAVETVNNGEAALENLTRTDYDLLVSDLRMPGSGGIKLFDEVSRLYPEILKRYLLITGDLINRETAEFLARCGTSVLEKPFDPRGLQSLAGSILDRG